MQGTHGAPPPLRLCPVDYYPTVRAGGAEVSFHEIAPTFMLLFPAFSDTFLGFPRHGNKRDANKASPNAPNIHPIMACSRRIRRLTEGAPAPPSLR